jgi:spore coat protein CotH
MREIRFLVASFFASAVVITSLVCCGEFLGFSPIPEPDLGNITKVRLHLSKQALIELYASVDTGEFTPCTYEEEGETAQAEIKVRGFTSRLDPKKSFTVKIVNGGEELGYAFEALGDFYVTNRLAMYLYRRVGLFAPVTEAVALFMNGEYLGAYNKLTLYTEGDLESHFGDSSSELYKCVFHDIGSDVPLHDKSEKRFPDNDNFTSLDTLVYNAKNMGDSEWFGWVADYVDRNTIVQYMLVHDFLAVRDVFRQNFFVYAYDRFVILPWDNEACMFQGPYELGGDNLINSRFMEEAGIRSLYNSEMERLFIDTGNIVDEIITTAMSFYDEIDKAVKHDPSVFVDYGDFLSERARVLSFLTGRSADIDPQIPLP